MNNKKEGVIILTSTGLSADSVRYAAVKYFATLSFKSVAIVTAASEGKENNKYSKLAEAQFKELGFGIVDFIDIENDPRTDFSKYNVIYVCGGNTFKLLKYAREAHFKKNIGKITGSWGRVYRRKRRVHYTCSNNSNRSIGRPRTKRNGHV